MKIPNGRTDNPDEAAGAVADDLGLNVVIGHAIEELAGHDQTSSGTRLESGGTPSAAGGGGG